MEKSKTTINSFEKSKEIKSLVKESSHFQNMIQSGVNLSIDDINLLIDSIITDTDFLKSMFWEEIYKYLKDSKKLDLSKSFDVPLSVDQYRQEFDFDQKLKDKINLLIRNTRKELESKSIPSILKSKFQSKDDLISALNIPTNKSIDTKKNWDSFVSWFRVRENRKKSLTDKTLKTYMWNLYSKIENTKSDIPSNVLEWRQTMYQYAESLKKKHGMDESVWPNRSKTKKAFEHMILWLFYIWWLKTKRKKLMIKKSQTLRDVYCHYKWKFDDLPQMLPDINKNIIKTKWAKTIANKKDTKKSIDSILKQNSALLKENAKYELEDEMNKKYELYKKTWDTAFYGRTDIDSIDQIRNALSQVKWNIMWFDMYDLDKYEKDNGLQLSQSEIRGDKIAISTDVYSELDQAPKQVLKYIKKEKRGNIRSFLFDKVIELVQMDFLNYSLDRDPISRKLDSKIVKTNIIIDGREWVDATLEFKDGTFVPIDFKIKSGDILLKKKRQDNRRALWLYSLSKRSNLSWYNSIEKPETVICNMDWPAIYTFLQIYILALKKGEKWIDSSIYDGLIKKLQSKDNFTRSIDPIDDDFFKNLENALAA